MECVTCVCVNLVLGVSGCQDWVWALQILEEHGESGVPESIHRLEPYRLNVVHYNGRWMAYNVELA